MYTSFRGLLVTAIFVLSLAAADAPKPAENAAELYLRAAEMRKPLSPAETNLEYADFPPFPRAWHEASEAAWEANGPMRDLARRARSLDHADWPDDPETRYLNLLRGLANEIADAALHELVHHRAAAAIEFVRDEFHLAKLLDPQPSRSLLRVLVSAGINASASNRLMVVTSDVALTSDEKNGVDLNVGVARQLIAELLDQRDVDRQMVELLGPRGSPGWSKPNQSPERIQETINRCNAERTLAAMSLACHLYHFDKGAWPTSLEQLVPNYVAKVPLDPWGDGKQTFGYVLIKGGLPDGKDRPLVYDRCLSRDGMFYRLDEPQYGFYADDGSGLPAQQRKQTGQFRDVTLWQPRNITKGQPTIAPLP
jgi:hypothetical protein